MTGRGPTITPLKVATLLILELAPRRRILIPSTSIANSQSNDAGVVYCWTQFSGALVAMTPGACPYILTIRTDDGIQFEKIGGDPTIMSHGNVNAIGARLGADCIPRFSSNGYF